ncbi:sporulation protein YunB [Clostridium omnivorum]|uniref:sporulation protein YunB n=1 Tax=Clostridium omnivorum TaxID=1604902 RepID=UPI0022315150|nr:sporulation protein YunB [Clostridium sp. E14]
MIKTKTKIKVIAFFSIVIFSFNIFIYEFDKVITPTLIIVTNAEMRAKAMEIINSAILDEYSKKFRYEDIIKVEKDASGNIVMVQADTISMSKISSEVALKAQKELKNYGQIGVKIPLGYIFKNNLLASMGPDLLIKMVPVGYVETKYLSEFESAGFNQTRHKIYVEVKAKVRVVMFLGKSDIDVKCEVPISETIIVGKIPNNAFNLDLNNMNSK